jgi:NADPH-dependent glutamate synthase beta subunit-like oxidoreductase
MAGIESCHTSFKAVIIAQLLNFFFIPCFLSESKTLGMEKNSIYIIGAGVSGLIAAYELEQKGYQPTIIESTATVGGRVKSIDVNGYNNWT